MEEEEEEEGGGEGGRQNEPTDSPATFRFVPFCSVPFACWRRLPDTLLYKSIPPAGVSTGSEARAALRTRGGGAPKPDPLSQCPRASAARFLLHSRDEPARAPTPTPGPPAPPLLRPVFAERHREAEENGCQEEEDAAAPRSVRPRPLAVFTTTVFFAVVVAAVAATAAGIAAVGAATTVAAGAGANDAGATGAQEDG